MTDTEKAGAVDFLKGILLLIVLVFVFCMGVNPASAEETTVPLPRAGIVANPGAELWREVRQREGPVVGTSQVRGVDTGVLINTGGQDWRETRLETIIPYSGYLLAGILAIIVVFRLIRGKVKIKAGRSGRRILRFTLSQRTVHWVVAILFVILGITGVVLLLGRWLLIPYIGNSAFSNIAAVCKLLHDYCGPAFGISLVFMFFYYVKDNLYRFKDIVWFLKGGGMLGLHAPAGRFNAGEKTWFWIAILVGIVVVSSGLTLDFPIFGLSRDIMEQANIIHAVSAVIIFAISFGHMYLATFGMEGALETMMTGYCDANWAKEHHDLWYEEVKDTEEVNPPDSGENKGQADNTSASPNPA